MEKIECTPGPLARACECGGRGVRTATGSIELIIGPMWAEKTSAMLNRLSRAEYAGLKTTVVQHSADDRYSPDPVVVTHSGRQWGGPTIAVAKLALAQLGPGVSVVGVDEGQFFPDLAETCDEWAARGIRVVVAALDGDAHKNPWPAVSSLIPRCETVEKLRGICTSCQCAESAFSRRHVEWPAGAVPAPPPDGAGPAAHNPVRIGGLGEYASVCRRCWRPPPG